jgi:O-succinylbenzoic acid--CoA ligase
MLARLLVREPAWHPPASLRAVLLGGAAASDDAWEEGLARRLPLLETWGMTETCAQVATAIPGGDPRAPVPLPGWKVRSPEGRLEVRGASLLTRYVEESGGPGARPPFDAGGWFCTGDLGRVNADGSVTVLGRADEMIVTGGQNVSPAEVERILESVPGVGRAAVVGVPDPAWGETVAAALEPEAGLSPADLPHDGTVVPPDLERLLAERFSPSNRPRTIVWMERLPETASGKIDRAEVRRRLTGRHRRA